MILSDGTIRRERYDGDLGIDPWYEANLQPASYELTLGSDFLLPLKQKVIHSVPRPEGIFKPFSVPPNGFFTLGTKFFVLATTVEKITVPANMVARVEGKSSLGRLGLTVHITAGFIDPGFSGQITFEMKSLAPWAITLKPGMKIAQIAFEYLDLPALRPYGSPGLGSHYQGQTGPTAP